MVVVGHMCGELSQFIMTSVTVTINSVSVVPNISPVMISSETYFSDCSVDVGVCQSKHLSAGLAVTTSTSWTRDH